MKPITPSQCAHLLTSANSLTILTGAGMSTAAGVPDFRGPKGLYVTRQYNPETVFEISYFDHDPTPFYQFSQDFLTLLKTIQPTYTHNFLASLEKQKPLTLITQNIDGLHQHAGSKNVLPIHGDYETSHCRKCGKTINGSNTLIKLMEKSTVPLCPDCNGVIKPDVVFFGENVRHLTEAYKAAENADLMLVLGSSLSVYPAAALPYETKGNVVIVNKGPVAANPGKNFHLADENLDDFFKEVAEHMK